MFPELVRVDSRPSSVAPNPIEISETLADRGH
jgi:hypothetical protein